MKIEIRGVTKQFAATPVLRELDLSVAEGEFFFILGPSGCGKTTLLRIIAGFEPPTQGDVLFDGESVLDLPPNRRRIGMVFQNYALWPHLTVRNNVEFGLDIQKLPRSEIAARVAEVLEMVQMTGYEDRLPNQLSGGQQQRIALARAIVTRPGLLLLDEPLSNLDARLRLEMRDELLRVQKATGITTIYVTHDQKEALSMADRMIILDGGRIVQHGSPLEVYRTPRTVFVAGFMGETNFVPGTVDSLHNDWVSVGTPLGPIAGPIRHASLQKGQRVVVSMRPESIQLEGERHEPVGARFSGQVEKTVFMGEVEHFWLRAGELSLKMMLSNPKPGLERPGTQLGLMVDFDDITVLAHDESPA